MFLPIFFPSKAGSASVGAGGRSYTVTGSNKFSQFVFKFSVSPHISNLIILYKSDSRIFR
jgi:hypothetical protein